MHKTDNVYALDSQKKMVFVLSVKNGKNNYTCPGCNREVLAIHRSKEEWKAYFKHHIIDATNKEQCTYRDETYRHKLAKDILQIKKRIKVPGLLKYPPHGIEGKPMMISKPRIIHAKKVLRERKFYEGEDNKVYYGSNPQIIVREHLIQPDITFLDENDKPILFVEVVATHQVDQAKYLKIKRLGIDTVQVKIPKDSPEEIEKAFDSVKHTKWIYNNELESTTYIPPSGTPTQGVPASDDFQEGFYDESFSCRTAQIGNLIRAIDRCFQSEYYSEVEEAARGVIEKAGKLTAGLEQRHAELQEEVESRALNQFKDAIEATERRRDSIENEYYSLEERYSRKRSSLENSISAARSKYQQRVDELGGTGKSLNERKADLRKEEDYQEQLNQGIRDKIESVRRDIERERYERKERIKAMGEYYRNELHKLNIETDTKGAQIERDTGEAERQERIAPERFKQLENSVRESIRRKEESIANAEREGFKSKDIPTQGGITAILNEYHRYTNLKKVYIEIERVRSAKEWFEQAPWKGWS